MVDGRESVIVIRDREGRVDLFLVVYVADTEKRMTRETRGYYILFFYTKAVNTLKTVHGWFNTLNTASGG